MVKYKLIKEYPDSLKLGTVVKYSERYCSYIYKDKEGGMIRYESYIIEKYPEYWEKIEEKEYKILSFINEFEEIFDLSKEGYYKNKYDTIPTIWRTEDWLLSHAKKCKVYSIQRLSDGEVFTLGDRVKSIGKLTEISLNNKKEGASGIKLKIPWFVGDDEYSGCYIGVAEKVKEPLFITEDGVEIYDSKQTVYYVDHEFRIIPETAKHSACVLDLGHEYKYYANKKAAENYVKLHKPVLSYKEVFGIFEKLAADDDWGVVTRGKFKQELTKLVKEKI